MSIARNPYYGVGLAVHSHLWSCTRCEFVGLLGLQRAGDDREPTEESRPTRWQRTTGALGRFFRMRRR